MREGVAESERPAMLYSVGKDSSVLLHLARKAFYPSAPPFPLVHDVEVLGDVRRSGQASAEARMDLIVHENRPPPSPERCGPARNRRWRR